MPLLLARDWVGEGSAAGCGKSGAEVGNGRVTELGAPRLTEASASAQGSAQGSLGLGTDGEQGHVVAATVVGEALHGLPYGRDELCGAPAGRGGGRCEQPVLVELLGAAPALGDAVGV